MRPFIIRRIPRLHQLFTLLPGIALKSISSKFVKLSLTLTIHILSIKQTGWYSRCPNGIPQNVIDKIFQPFFTTKPTGQGTGLGLSLAYDIIKEHGGEIKVNTKEGEGSEVTIQLPFNP